MMRICASLTIAVILTSGCRRLTEAARSDHRDATTPVAVSAVNRRGRERCEVQAARLAAANLWRGRSLDPADERLLRWVSHYSDKYDDCYVLLDHQIGVQNGAAAVVSELWDGFGAAVLASYTQDRRSTIRRQFCQVDLSDDPFTSCLVSQYFVAEHMTH
jgi:hypothetical protein